MNRYIGIDPGVQGGIAWIDVYSGYPRDEYMAVKMPGTEKDLLSLLARLQTGRAVAAQEHNDRPQSCRAMLEYVRAFPSMGKASIFTFGRGYGSLRTGLVATGIPFDEVRPSIWQGTMQCRTKGKKAVTRRRAQELFPHLKITNATADALLIAEYGRRVAKVP